MRTLGYMLGSAQRATASGARIFQILDREPRLVAPAGRRALPADGGGRVELRDASLRFEGANRDALADVDLDVAAGSTVALVGATGSGKSSLVSLIPRLYDVTGGAVLVDGVDVRDARPGALRARDRRRDRRPVPLLGHRAREHRLRRRLDASREQRRGRRAPRAGGGLHRGAPRRLRHARRRARPDARPAASASGSRSPARCSPTRGS